MTANEAYNTYKNMMINTTVDKLQIVAMLYEGALGFAKNAIESAKQKDEELFIDNMNRVIGILLALRDSLDPNADKETVDYLTALYNFLIEKSINAIELFSDDKFSEDEFSIVIRYLSKMHEIWTGEVMGQTK
ncbi:flagellar export chaperone FliS [Hippea maritima]|uniref:Flagellar protein FliS n=1 Tax=Hippea maritima (strain ATCC 700847 / DSM 10411 / MH2) TaxID=760142 RepID=F2LVR3_HIPMA|nr:flagellar export chaperone FliS [Hippea maritima]AEA33847.1 flagellar protein FliS [Hippea maritima DSM 10411]